MFGRALPRNGRVGVKICGITNRGDAEAAIDAGADALGFNFSPLSTRYIEPWQNGQWISELPSDIIRVAVLVNPTLSAALQIADFPFIDALQLHGSESPDFCQKLAERRVVFAKALPVSANHSLQGAPHFFTDTILLDSVSNRGFGGSGRVLPWPVGREFVDHHPALKVILAGGLGPENVAKAIKTVRPFAVDVTTGVECSPGRKDRDLLRAFVASARAA
jgi:phosphoribosylanthranilate isomerase